MAKKSTAYGWYGLLAAILIAVILQGTLGNQMGLLLEPICSDLGIARTMFSTLMSLTTIVNFICSMTFAKFLSTLGIKKMSIIGALGAILYCLFLMLAGRFTGTAAVALIALGQLCLGVTFSWSGAMAISIFISNWFAKRASTMISIASAFAGLTGTFASPLITSWIINNGWAASLLYRVIPTAILFVLFFFVRVNPGKNDARIWDDGAVEADNGEAAAAIELPGLTLAEARKTKNFWFGIITSFGLGSFIYPAAMICLPALAVDAGFAANSGTVMSVVFVANLIMTLVTGGLVEKFGCRKVLIPIFVITTVGMVMLSMKGFGLSSMYVAAFLLGMGYALVAVAVPFITMDAFGLKDFGSIQSFLFSAMVLGMAVGSPLFNAIYDLSGSYSASYIVGAAACVVLIITLLLTTTKIKAD